MYAGSLSVNSGTNISVTSKEHKAPVPAAGRESFHIISEAMSQSQSMFETLANAAATTENSQSVFSVVTENRRERCEKENSHYVHNTVACHICAEHNKHC